MIIILKPNNISKYYFLIISSTFFSNVSIIILSSSLLIENVLFPALLIEVPEWYIFFWSTIKYLSWKLLFLITVKLLY